MNLYATRCSSHAPAVGRSSAMFCLPIHKWPYSRCWCSGDTPYAGMYRWPIRSRRRMNRSP